jgi:succinoglycan biosynthesis transport protein ExoP
MAEHPRLTRTSDERRLVSSTPGLLRRSLEPGGNPFAPPKPGITPGFILQSLARWWPWALPAALVLSAIAAAIAWLTFEPTFEAESWIRIEDRRPFVAFPSQDESKRFVQTQVETIRSPIVLGQCLSQPEIAQLPELKAELDPVKWVLKRLSISSVAESELYRIKFKGPNPDHAAKIVNAIVDTYLKHHTAQSTTESRKVIEVLERLKADRMRELGRLQEGVRSLTKLVTGKDAVNGLGGTQRESASALGPLAALETRLADVEIERQIIEVEYEAAKQALHSQDQGAVPPDVIERFITADAEVVRMTAELQQIRDEAKHLEDTSAQPQQLAAFKTLAKRFASLKEELVARQEQLKKQASTETQKELLGGLRANVDAYAAELKKQQMLEELLRKRVAEQRAELEKLGDESLNLEFARAELQRAEEVFRRLCDRITALQTEKEAETRVRQLNPATPPVDPVTTSVKFVGPAAALFFVLPFGLSVLWELRVRRIASVDQLRDEARLPVIGEITALPARSLIPSPGATARFERQRSLFEESIAQLRTTLILCDDTANLQVIAVASAVSREGKTSVASQLATHMAKASNEPTLLIDADVRDPDIHQLFETALSPGLSEVLENQASLADAIVPSTSSALWLLPAGQYQVSPHTLFSGTTFRTLIEALRARYRHIVIDCPPLLAASEALVAAKIADGTLLCTMRDVSRTQQVREARERLSRAGVSILGVVISGVSTKGYYQRYGGYHYATTQRYDTPPGDE